MKKLFTFLLFAMMGLAHVSLAWTNADLEFTITSTTTVSVKGKSGVTFTGKLSFPTTMTINGKSYSVTSIADNGFKDQTQITSVEFHSGIKTIGSSAFNGCKGLTVVNLPDNITTVGSSAFGNCSNVESVYIGKNASSISQATFGGNIKISDFGVSPQNPNYTCEKRCLLSSDGKRLIWAAPNVGDVLEIPTSVTTLDNYSCSFSQCQEIIVPQGVSTLPNGFLNSASKLQTLDLPSTLSKLHPYSLTSALREIRIANYPPTLTVENETLHYIDKSKITLRVPYKYILSYKNAIVWSGCKDYLYYVGAADQALMPNTKSLTNSAGLKFTVFSPVNEFCGVSSEGCSGAVIIPSSATIGGKEYRVARVDNSGFSQNNAITSVEGGGALIEVGNSAFSGCRSLTSAKIHAPKISDYAFAYTALTHFEIQNESVELGQEMFLQCTKLRYIWFYTSTPPTFSGRLFYNDSREQDMYSQVQLIVNNTTNFKNDSFWKQFQSIKSASYIKVIDGDLYKLSESNNTATLECKAEFGNLFILPQQVKYNDTEYTITKVGDQAFAWSNIDEMLLSANVQEVGARAFNHCDHLQNIAIGGDTKFSSDALSNCVNLTDVSLLCNNPQTLKTYYPKLPAEARIHIHADADQDRFASHPEWGQRTIIKDADFEQCMSFKCRIDQTTIDNDGLPHDLTISLVNKHSLNVVQILLQLPEGLEPVLDSKGTPQVTGLMQSTLASILEDGTIRLFSTQGISTISEGLQHRNGLQASATARPLFTIKVKSTSASGQKLISMSADGACYDTDYYNKQLEDIHCLVRVLKNVAGDANLDERLSVADITTIVHTGGDGLDSRADVNGDTFIDKDDIELICKAILNK